jgi:hypothetical protein
MTTVLPAAFYALNCVYRADFLYGKRTAETDFEQLLPVRIDVLSAEVLRQFMQGREWLRLRSVELAQDILPKAIADETHCTHQVESDASLECLRAVKSWWDNHYPLDTKDSSGGFDRDPLVVLKRWDNSLNHLAETNASICPGHRIHMKYQFQKAQQYLWRDLPAFFNLPTTGEREGLTDWETYP